MANEFYTPGGNPSQGSQLQSSPIRTEFSSIQAGFDKLPTMTGNGGEVVVVNAGGTALEATPTPSVGAVNTSKVTVASAATPDIFGAAGQLIDYTGTATCTGFTAAAKAGMYRELYCADACLFTAGANLLIEGIPSGTTITLAAGALVQVRAITTTQFKMTYSVSGTFTITGTGFTVNPTATAVFKVENGIVNLHIPYSAIYGTSNAPSFTLTGLPSCIAAPVGVKYLAYIGLGADNGTACYVAYSISSNVISLHKNSAGLAWTSSGVKSMSGGTLTYSVG